MVCFGKTVIYFMLNQHVEIIPACHVRAGCGFFSVSSGTDLYLYSPSVVALTYGSMLLQVMPQDTKQENTRQNLFHHTSSIKVSDQNIHPTNST